MANNSENIKKMLEQLYSDRDQTGDAVFIVESQQIRAHRNVLAACSPKYKAQFYGPNPDQGEIRIPNVSAAAFQEFLQFFYKESVDLTMGHIASVLDLAQQSLVEGFIEICVDFLKKSIPTGNVCFVYHLAIIYDIECLCRACEQHISSNTAAVIASDGFQQCDRDVLLHILKLNSFSCSEKDVFNACIEWARMDCKQKGLDEKSPKHLRESLGDAIHLIRFSSINAQEFATLLHGLNGFFSADELIELFSLTAKVKDFIPQKFNQSTRIQPRDCLEADVGTIAWSLECDRFVERVINDRAPTNETFKFKVHCEKPIRLYGLAFGFNLNGDNLNKYKNWNTVVISIERDNGSLETINRNCKYYQAKNETIIMFDDPIERLKVFEFVSQSSALEVNYKLVLKDQIVVDGNQFTCSDEFLTRFFFDNL